MIDNDFASILDRVRKNKYLLIDNLYDTLIQRINKRNLKRGGNYENRRKV